MTIYRGKSGHFASKAEIAAIKAATQTQPVANPAHKELIAYKGFYKGNDGIPTCRNFKFEIGKEYNISGNPDPCYVGFHACPNPFDMFRYYNLNASNVFGRVKLLGPIGKREDKYAAKGIIVEEIFHMSHLINLLAKYAKENSLNNVNLNKKSTVPMTWDIKTTYGNGGVNVYTQTYGHQLSTVTGDNMYQHGYNSTQIGGASQQRMFSSSCIQISAGNNTMVINDNVAGEVDIQGKCSQVRLLQQGAMFRGPEGTKFELHGKGKVFTGVVGENGIAPNKWTGITPVRINPEFVNELRQK